MNYIFKTILFKNYSFPCVFNLRHVFIVHNVRFQKITEYKLKIQVDMCFDHIHTTPSRHPLVFTPYSSSSSSPYIHTILLLLIIPPYSHHTPHHHHPPHIHTTLLFIMPPLFPFNPQSHPYFYIMYMVSCIYRKSKHTNKRKCEIFVLLSVTYFP